MAELKTKDINLALDIASGECMHFKGQVSTEYLVILAVVLVVALVVVALVGGVTPVSSGVTESQSKNYWQSSAPISITGWRYGGTTLELTLQNMEGRQVIVNGIAIEGSSVFTTNTTLSVGESKTVAMTLGSDCGSGDFELNNVTFTYSELGVSGYIQNGIKPIVGACS